MYAHLYQGSRAGHGPDPADKVSAGAVSQPGLLGSITFRQLAGPADACLTLWDTKTTLDAAARLAMSTELMPGEDPALLPGPDRIEIHHVTSYHPPAASPAAS